jgi:ABC-type branched-subunit amino acid transport system ATPase component
MNAVLGDAIDSLTEVSGTNFSGRTDFIRNSVEAARGLYLYPEIPDNFSGLAVTVRDELAMGSSSRLDDEILAPFALKNLRERNPTELSGGEQASVVLAAALCSGTALIGRLHT